ncbi:MAG: hypothetical protein LW821_13865 [Flammeovirgaceae bacterium]|nr:hypothetical protein [Flammeovirgaceae bacterium]
MIELLLFEGEKPHPNPSPKERGFLFVSFLLMDIIIDGYFFEQRKKSLHKMRITIELPLSFGEGFGMNELVERLKLG